MPQDSKERERAEKIGHSFLNTITGGDYFDTRNLNHVLGVNPVSSELLGHFRVDSLVSSEDLGGTSSRHLWLASGENAYASRDNFTHPIMIMTPRGLARRLFEKSLPLNYKFQVDPASDFHKTYEVDALGGSLAQVAGPGHLFNELFFLANYPFTSRGNTTDKCIGIDGWGSVNWSDAFDVIIDLKIGKVFRHVLNPATAKSIDASIEAYRKVLREHFGVDLSHLEGVPTRQEKISGEAALDRLWGGLTADERLLVYRTLDDGEMHGRRDSADIHEVAAGNAGFMVGVVVDRLRGYLERHPLATLDDVLAAKRDGKI